MNGIGVAASFLAVVVLVLGYVLIMLSVPKSGGDKKSGENGSRNPILFVGLILFGLALLYLGAIGHVWILEHAPDPHQIVVTTPSLEA